jgi:hypothetical protein
MIVDPARIMIASDLKSLAARDRLLLLLSILTTGTSIGLSSLVVVPPPPESVDVALTIIVDTHEDYR